MSQNSKSFYNGSFKKVNPRIFAALGILSILTIYLSAFIVDQTQYAVKIRLGDPVQIYKEPGLYFKIPLITKIFLVDNRLLTYDAEPGSVITKDKKEMSVDNYAKWKIVNPLVFYKAMRGGSISAAQSRLDDVIYSQVRRVLGKHTLSEIVSGESSFSELKNRSDDSVLRQTIIEEITTAARENVKSLGLDIADVRVKRADLPASNSQAVYGRMIAERRRDAKRYRSEGNEEALKIRSQAERERIDILSESARIAEEIRGAGDATALEIYANAYGKDPDFFRFLRTHDAYRTTLNDQVTLLLSSERKFLKELD